MRFILVDHARGSVAQRRGGEKQQVLIETGFDVADTRAAGVLAVHDALTDLAKVDERKARVVEMRVFAGLSVDESAKALRRVRGHDQARLAIRARLAAARALTMSDDRWQRVNDLFHAALERRRPSASRSSATPVAATTSCTRDVVSLIAADAETPVIAAGAPRRERRRGLGRRPEPGAPLVGQESIAIRSSRTSARAGWAMCTGRPTPCSAATSR